MQQFTINGFTQTEVTTNVIIFGLILFGVLNVILFFKIWNATDNIKRITEAVEQLAATDSKEENP